MPSISDHPISSRWPASDPSILQLYSFPTPNGVNDPDGPGGEQLSLWESGAILIYLAEKTGKLIPTDPSDRAETLQWLMFQMGGIGPMFGQFGFFNVFAGK